MHLMLENVDSKDRAQLLQELTGPFRTMGPPMSEDELNAPAWWHGDDEAFAGAEALMSMYGGRMVSA